MYESLELIYTFIPREVLLIILGGIATFVMLEISDRKQKQLEKKRKRK